MKTFFYSLVFTVAPILSIAQDLRLPATPAFSILGHEPAAVMRPTSVKSLSGDILGSFDEQGKLLPNLGLEVTPYWLQNQPELTREEYLNPNLGQAFLQSFTFSAATVKDSITDRTNLGIGLRFTLLKGRLSNDFIELENAIKADETKLAAILSAGNQNPATPENLTLAIANIKNLLQRLSLAPETIKEVTDTAEALKSQSYATVDTFCQAVLEHSKGNIAARADQLIKLEGQRNGFSLGFAGAAKFATTSGEPAVNRLGFWVNGSYSGSANHHWNASVRITTSTTDTLRVNSDLGFSYTKKGEAYNISLEAMVRWYRTELPGFDNTGEAVTFVEKDFTYRIALQASYTISKDISANLTIGKDFDRPEMEVTGLFSMIGLNYSIFNRDFIIR